VTDRPLRADARRNRARVLAAAEAVFADKGVTASTEEVARAAGVGIGTVFRHFPTKEALLEAVFVDRLRQLARYAEELADAPDPGAAFFEFFTRMVENSVNKNADAAARAAAGVDVRTALAEVKTDLLEAMDVLLHRAQQAGAVRADLAGREVVALLVGAARAAEMLADPTAAARALAVTVDGMRQH
jgi:AcrR family transcriptional regulator